jgi:hypothetical protein
MPGPCQINGWLPARRTKNPLCGGNATHTRFQGWVGYTTCGGQVLVLRKKISNPIWVWTARKENGPPWKAAPVKSGTVFHYTSINVRVRSAVKCAGYLSRKVESANATIGRGWGKIPILGRRRIPYEAAHLCAQEPHLRMVFRAELLPKMWRITERARLFGVSQAR